MHCKFIIDLPEIYRITIHLTFLSLEASDGCFNDSLRIMSSDGSHMRTWCGEYLEYIPHELTYESDSSIVNVSFISNYNIEGTGFRLTYTAAKSCRNTTYTKNAGEIYSPNVSGNYLNMQNCYYVIKTTNPLNRIHLIFISMNTDSLGDVMNTGSRCTMDYVEIDDGRSLHRICGDWAGSDYLQFWSIGNFLSVRFHSDKSITKSGYFAKWSIVSTNLTFNYCENDSVIDMGAYCFQIIYRKMSWDEGNMDCVSKGGHLATIYDESKFLIVQKELNTR